MNDQERAKAAVEWLKVAYVWTQDDISAREYARNLLRPIAAGTHVIRPIEPSKEMWRSGTHYSDHAASVYRAMIAASKEGE